MRFVKLCATLLVVHLFSIAHAQFQYSFEHVDKQLGGPTGVYSMIQDSRGFIWLGSGRGLYRYDGYRYKLFVIEPGSKNNLTLNSISSVFEDRSGKIWIGTGEGPVRFDPVSETFELFPFFNDAIKTGKVIVSFAEDQQDKLWFTFRTDMDSVGGLVFFDHANKVFQVFNFDGMLFWPRNIFVDPNKNFWIGCQRGVVIFNPLDKKLVKHIPFDNVSAVHIEPGNAAWVTSFSTGVSKLEYDDQYNLKPVLTFQERNGLMTNTVGAMTIDNAGNRWFPTMQGVIVLNPNHDITNLRPSNENNTALKHWWCNAVLNDKSGVVWVGYNDHGISRLKNNKGFINISMQSMGFETLADNHVTAVYSDSNDNIWIGVGGKGLYKVNFNSDFKRRPKVSFYPHLITWINDIAEDENGQILLAISDTGVCTLDQASGRIKPLIPNGTSMVKPLPDGSLLLSDVRRIYLATKKNSRYTVEELQPDSTTRMRRVHPEFSSIATENNNGVWLSTWQGDLYYRDLQSKTFTSPTITPQEPLRIIDVIVDSKKFLWVTAFEGVFKFKIVHHNEGVELILVRKYTEKDGFISRSGASEVFNWSTMEDNNGDLWFKGVGVARLNTSNDSLTRYYATDGLIEGSTPMQGSAKLKSGHLVFGTPEGLFLFHPDSLQSNAHVPPIAITDFTVLNKPVVVPAQEQVLKHFENVMSFEFAALDFTDPRRNQYAYQMVGFDPSWVYSGNRRTATYTNLDPGTYTFRVKGSNNDGVWNKEGISVNIRILPPPWKTWWAYTIYGLMLIGALVLVRNELIKRERLKSKAKLKELEVAQFHELDALKSRFFANISHEFRTPLTLLLGPLKHRLEKATDPSDKAEVDVMLRNATRLLHLVNQLLDLSKLEARSLKLKCKKLNVRDYLYYLSSQFSSMAESMELKFTVNAESVELFADPDQLEKIVINLLSNAFKFTGKGGMITLSLTKHGSNVEFPNGYAEISVADSGIGIEPANIKRIFDRFYQVDSRSVREYEGSGIGLALTKELVELHHGTISVVSEPPKGSCFVVRFHLGMQHLQENEIDLEPADISMKEVGPKTVPSTEDLTRPTTTNGLPHILIVEDNAELRHFLKKLLSDKYVINDASDGAEGVAKAIDEIPDLVLSDLMMPTMDGLELCDRLKKNPKTSHIPIILLTAKAGIDDKLKGLETGADDYLVKPFNSDELKARVATLIEGRKKLHQYFSQRVALTVSGVQAESIDDKFLNKVRGAIDRRLSDTSLSVEDVATEVAMSTTQLYRKLKALTGQTPNELIRNIRLDHAALLLKQHAGNVADVAYATGFNNLSYFSKVFKEKFGVTPSEYLKQAK